MENNTNKLSPKKNRSRQRFILIIAAISMLYLFFAPGNAATVFTQTKDKKDKEISRITFENEPIEFIKIESDGRAIKLNEKFVQEDDWLKDLTVKFKNISDKPIVYVSIVVDFPETESTGPLMVNFLKYGAHPLVPPMRNDKKELLAPGDAALARLSPEEFTMLKNFLIQRHLLADLTKANHRIMTVHFADGTIWMAGTIFRPDPNRSGKFIPVDKKNQKR